MCRRLPFDCFLKLKARINEIENKLEDWNVVVDLGAVSLRYALGNPDDVTTLLLLQLQERVEDAKVELLQERVHVQLDLKGIAPLE